MDTSGPARIAAVRVTVAAAVGLLVMFPLDRVIVGPDGLLGAADALGLAWALPVAERAADDVVRLGAVGLALGSAVAAWTELVLLARRARYEAETVSALAAPATAAALCFATAAALKLAVGDWPAFVSAPLVGAAGAAVYAVAAHRQGLAEANLLLQPARRIIWSRQDQPD